MSQLKILLPVDFSDQSEFAVEYAKNFSRIFDVQVLVLHVLEISAFVDINREGHFEDFMGINTEMLEIQQNTAKQKMKAFYEREKNSFREMARFIKVGPLTETILSFAEKRKVDMILMGTKGAERLKAWFSGSETQIVARRSEIPVLSVMCNRSGADIEDILFISDFSDIDIAIDPVVILLAEGFGARLHLLSIASDEADDPEVKRQEIEEYAQAHHLKNYEIHIHRDRKVLDGINKFDQMGEMDLIALGTHGRKGISHLLRGSIAEKLINHLYKPVLVYKI